MKYIIFVAFCLSITTMKIFSQDTNKVPTITHDLASMPNTTIVYYDITGSTEMEIREQMNLLRPMNDKDSVRYDGLTDWSYQLSWPGYGTTDCDLGQAVITFKIIVTLPRWVPPPNVSSNLVAKWEKYIQALVAHEKGHVDNVVANYTTVLAAIKNSNCYTAIDNAKAALDRIQAQEKFYDTVTNHGMNRGAVFP